MTKNQRKLILLLLVGLSSIYIYKFLFPESDYGNITVDQASELLDSKPKIVLIDVRTQEEYNEEHIEGAILIPVLELENRINELSKEEEVLVYCRTGNRSQIAISILKANDFQKIYHMDGGITAWKLAGYPTV